MTVTGPAIEAAATAFWNSDQFRIRETRTPTWDELAPDLQGVCRDIVAPLLHAAADLLEAETLRAAVASGEYVKVTRPQFGEISDGFGSTWALCRPDCGLQVVRPGKVQCDHEGTTTSCGPAPDQTDQADPA